MESAGDLVVDSHVMNEGNPWAGSGANPWHLDQDTESILFLTNESGQPAHIGFKVTANGSPSYFLTSLLLNPQETRAIDLRKLRDAQTPDFKKNKVPGAAADGSVIWIRGDNLPVMGRLMLIHRHLGMASNYDCNQCACPYTYDPLLDYVYPDGANLLVADTQPLTYYGGFLDCNHNPYYYNENGSTSWTSEYPSVATVDSSGTVTAQSGGTSTITGQFSGYAYVWNEMMWYCSSSLLQGEGSATIDVGDQTPVVSSVTPSPWVSGHTYTNGTISGQYFGTSPTASLSDPTITFSYTPISDSQISFSATIPASTSSEKRDCDRDFKRLQWERVDCPGRQPGGTAQRHEDGHQYRTLPNKLHCGCSRAAAPRQLRATVNLHLGLKHRPSNGPLPV